MPLLKAEELYDTIGADGDTRVTVSAEWLAAEERQLLARVQWLRKLQGKKPLISEEKLEQFIRKHRGI